MKPLFKIILALVVANFLTGCISEDTVVEKSAFFVKLYGGILQEEGINFEQTSDGGYILFGSANSDTISENGNKDLYLVRTNSEGNVIWERTYGSALDDEGVDLETTSQGFYMVGTQVNADGTKGIYMVFVGDDISGNATWEKSYTVSGSDYIASDIAVLADGSLLVTAVTNNLSIPNENPEDMSDIVLLKFDAQGDFLFTDPFGGSKTGFDFARSSRQINDSIFLIFGSTFLTHKNTNKIMLQKENINTLSTASGGRPFDYIDGNDHLAADYLILNDGYIIAGNMTTSSGDRDIFVHKIDNSFNISNVFQTNPVGLSGDVSGDDEAVSMLKLPSGFLVLGNTNSFSGSDQDIFLTKFDDTGVQIWSTDSRIFGASGDDLAGKVIRTMDGGLAIICTISVDGRSDVNRNTEMCLIKMNSEGRIEP